MPNAQDTTELRVAANGDIYVAPFGTTLPTTEAAALNAEFRKLGLADEDGVVFTDEKTIQDIRAWQRFYPARKIVTERMASVAFKLLQWNGDTVTAAFGGGDITTVTAGHFKYSPPDPEDLEEVSVVVDWRDGDFNYRFVIPKAISTETVETNLVRTDAAKLPITFSALGDDDQAAWFILTDDPAIIGFNS